MSQPSAFRRRFGVILAATLLTLGAPFVTLLGSATAVEVKAEGVTTAAKVDRAQPTVGQRVVIAASVKSDTRRQALVDVEVYDRSGRKVFQKYWDNLSFNAGQTRVLRTAWSTRGLSAGPYSVKVGVFGSGWTSLVHWNGQAATVRLVTAATTPTTAVPTITAVPTTTAAPTTTTAVPTTTAAPTTTTAVPTTTTAVPTTTASPTTTAAPPTGKFTTLPVGAALPTGAQCSAQVRPAAEIRPENAAANSNRGSRAVANTRTDWAGFSRVDGDFAGTTDQIIQWAACKWGIDEDIVRAQVIKESYWYQSANGDNGESWGLGQVRDTAHPSAFQYAVNARTSSSYNLDYTYASWRACYEGAYTWLNTVEHNGTYASGDVWGCVGLWFSGRWYINNDSYLNQAGDSVHWHYNNKTWLTATFING